METAVVIVSILLIAIVLLQSGKAESANIIQGGGSELFQNRKERGWFPQLAHSKRKEKSKKGFPVENHKRKSGFGDTA